MTPLTRVSPSNEVTSVSVSTVVPHDSNAAITECLISVLLRFRLGVNPLLQRVLRSALPV